MNLSKNLGTNAITALNVLAKLSSSTFTVAVVNVLLVAIIKDKLNHNNSLLYNASPEIFKNTTKDMLNGIVMSIFNTFSLANIFETIFIIPTPTPIRTSIGNDGVAIKYAAREAAKADFNDDTIVIWVIGSIIFLSC